MALELKLVGSGNKDYLMYSILRSGYSSPLGSAKASLIDGHYVLSEHFSYEKDFWYQNVASVFGVEHKFSNTNNKLYSRMRQRAEIIAKREKRTLIEEVEIIYNSQ
ncbi:hypothetical protein HN385_05865 [archaeon]|jgi:hypothetical protein|nr:hypothetical protein [archaeon]MBT3451114.1 hypothetical protein [archaeon]MBT6868642.1 hypothetical protein [archaeon]MBT7193391.1 hypothetical protein [archaeon]MBT7381439.1 hypothetical protein [archaeon]